MDEGDPASSTRMNRRINVRLAAALLPLLVAAAVLGVAHSTDGAGTDGDPRALTAVEPAAFDNVHGDGLSRLSGIQECRAGPSKCTGPPGLVSATSLYDQLWTLAPTSFAREIFGPDEDFALESPTFRMKPPPRET